MMNTVFHDNGNNDVFMSDSIKQIDMMSRASAVARRGGSQGQLDHQEMDSFSLSQMFPDTSSMMNTDFHGDTGNNDLFMSDAGKQIEMLPPPVARRSSSQGPLYHQETDPFNIPEKSRLFSTRRDSLGWRHDSLGLAAFEPGPTTRADDSFGLPDTHLNTTAMFAANSFVGRNFMPTDEMELDGNITETFTHQDELPVVQHHVEATEISNRADMHHHVQEYHDHHHGDTEHLSDPILLNPLPLEELPSPHHHDHHYHMHESAAREPTVEEANESFADEEFDSLLLDLFS